MRLGIERLFGSAAVFALFTFFAVPAFGAVERIDILDRSVVADGQSFGAVGPYVRLSGRLTYSVDPDSQFNAAIKDLTNAPRDARGRVLFSGDFVLLMPADPERRSGRLLYDVTNRGGMTALSRFNDSSGRSGARTREDMGNGFLLEQGYSILWTGWNWDVRPRTNALSVDIPVATLQDGRAITGRITSEIAPQVPTETTRHTSMGAIGYSPANPAAPNAVLSFRVPGSQVYQPLPRDSWSFTQQTDGLSVPDPAWITLKGGFVEGNVYRLEYTAKNPPVVGLGLAAIRDALSFFRFERADSTGTLNPLRANGGTLPRAAIAYGLSQSGRALNTMILNGLHVDEAGRMVFDAALIDVAGAGKGSFNFRFAQTSRHFSQDIDLDYPTDYFPFTTVEQTDDVTGETGGLLAEARRLNAVPKMFVVNTSTEYWARSASLIHTSTDGTTDIAPAENVRLYVIAGGQHGVNPSYERGALVHCRNALDYRPIMRALLSHLDAWTTNGREPPPSQFPRVSDGSLVTVEQYRAAFPDAPFLRTPAQPLMPPRLDHGPRFMSEGVATFVPPRRGPVFQTRIPMPNEDGLDTAGLVMPDITVPLGTYTGWNPQNAETGAPTRLSRWFGSFIPFARTVPERAARDDPRLAITERYASKEDFTSAFAEKTLELAADEFILGLDINPMIERAGALYDRIMAHVPTDESCAYLSTGG